MPMLGCALALTQVGALRIAIGCSTHFFSICACHVLISKALERPCCGSTRQNPVYRDRKIKIRLYLGNFPLKSNPKCREKAYERQGTRPQRPTLQVRVRRYGGKVREVALFNLGTGFSSPMENWRELRRLVEMKTVVRRSFLEQESDPELNAAPPRPASPTATPASPATLPRRSRAGNFAGKEISFLVASADGTAFR